MSNKLKRKLKFRLTEEGYTLIEIVIVLMITSIVFTSIYALFAKSMKYDTEGRYEIVASELVQEGLEIIKNKKEKNEMDWAVWNGNDDPDTDLKTFKDIEPLDINDCNPSLTWDTGGDNYEFKCDNTSTKIQYSPADNEYKSNCSGGGCVGQEFIRKCSSELKGDFLRVTCKVSWESPLLNGADRSVNASLILTDWER